jgi:hypothetical protein
MKNPLKIVSGWLDGRIKMNAQRRKWPFTARGIAQAMAVILVLVLTGGHAQMAGTGGIDPLEILKQQAKPNVFIVLDTSGSMRESIHNSGNATTINAGELVGDDENAKLFQSKKVLKTIVNNNYDKVNFNFATYEQPQPAMISSHFFYVNKPTDADHTAACAMAFNTTALARNTTNDSWTESVGNKYCYVRAERWWNGETVTFTDNTNFSVANERSNMSATPKVTITADGGTAVFTFAGTRYDKTPGGTTTATCGGWNERMTLSACDAGDSQKTTLLNLLRNETALGTNGDYEGYNGGTDDTPGEPSTTNIGVRSGGYTPIRATLQDMWDAWRGTGGYYATRVKTVTPPPASFLIFVSDGDDTCAGGTSAQNAQYAAWEAENLYNQISATHGGTACGDTSGGSCRLKTFYIVFGAGASTNQANAVAWGGSGCHYADSDNNHQWDDLPNSTWKANNCPNATDAFVASNASALETAIQNAIDMGSSTGRFVTAASVYEAIFEWSSDPMDPDVRFNPPFDYAMIQAEFELPGFEGHLKAWHFTSTGSMTGPVWDAGTQLLARSTGVTTGSTFAQLHGSGNLTNALIKRRIFTTDQNGIASLHGATGNGMDRVNLWPPDSTVTDGDLDNALGIGSMDLAMLQATFGACTGTNLPTSCTEAIARTEAREMILAYMAGAQVVTDATGPIRDGDNNLTFSKRSWILADSTIASPAISKPPLFEQPDVHRDEYLYYRDGFDTVDPADIQNGFGLRRPDFSVGTSNDDFKPIMTVAYMASNDMLHAFRVGGCGTVTCSAYGLTADTGGEELWGFVPYDQLGKLRLLLKGQSLANHIYMMASNVRFADVFVPGATTVHGKSLTGKWRRVLIVGRGPGGKYYSALDITSPGPFTHNALDAYLPDVLWNRGNPDTPDGVPAAKKQDYNHDENDGLAYDKMGETWSTPAIGRVSLSSSKHTTDRKKSGVEYVAWVGSGYSSVSTEGKTFYALDVLTGDVIKSADAPDNTGVPSAGCAPASPCPPQNAIVASPSAFSPVALSNLSKNPAGALVSRVYVGDVHGRVWKFNVESSVSALVRLKDLGVSQPIATAAALLNWPPSETTENPYVFVVAGNDSRVKPPAGGFEIRGLRDTAASATDQTWDKGVDVLFKNGVTPLTVPTYSGAYRGKVPPSIALAKDLTSAVVYFVGSKFNPATNQCASSFDSVWLVAQSEATVNFNAGNLVEKTGQLVVGQSAPGAAVQGKPSGTGKPCTPNNQYEPTEGSTRDRTVSMSLLRTDTSVCR